MIARQLEGTDIAVPFNVVNENLRSELVKRGVRIGEPEGSNAGRASRAVYEQWRNEAAENYEGLTIKSALGRNSSGEIAPSLVNSGAKLDNASDIHKGLDDISAKITQTGSLGGHELLYGIAQAFGFKGINLNHSKYFDIGHGAQLRIADHYGSVDEHNRRGRTTDNYGFVIKLSSNKFRSDPSVDYFEAVYYPDRITNPNRQQAIINGLKRFVDTGDFTELALPDRINPSGKWREVFPKERGGKDARAIKLATGWERGKDGKWRHEERDFDEVSMAGNLRWLADNPDAKRYLELLRKSTHSIFGGGAALSPDERKELDQLRGEVKGIDFSKPLRNADRLTLEDFVRDDRLFSAYPELRDVRVELVDDKDTEERGHYSESDATIVDLLNPDTESKTNRSITLNTHHLRNLDDFKKTLAHEVQHAVQAMEGFARGDDPARYDDLAQLRHDLQEDKYELTDINAKLEAAADLGYTEQTRMGRYTVAGLRERKEKLEERIKTTEREIENYIKPYDRYRRATGEVEARNVSKRMDMTDEQRRQSLAADTEDVARDEQIVRFGNGVSAMGSRVDKRMAEIGRLLEGRDMTDEQRKVADVFSGKSDKSILEIEKDGSVITIELMQGGENKAGSKHAVFRHYDTREGYFTSDDILVIPEIVKNGERTIDGRKASYTLDKDGVKYTFATERKGSSERMVTFYTDRKAPAMSSQNTSKDARTDTADALIGGKGSENSADGQMDGGETTGNGVNFRVRGGVSGEPADHTTAVEEARRRLESDDASEFERTAARAVIKAYGGGSDDAPDTPGGGVRFRTRDDADMLVDMAKHNNEVARQRRDAVTDFVKAITDVDELTDSKFATALGKVMRGQRQYDQDTVADITTMVKAMMDAGLLTELDNFSVKQILTKVKDSTGKNDITAEANKLIDIMLKHQLRFVGLFPNCSRIFPQMYTKNA